MRILDTLTESWLDMQNPIRHALLIPVVLNIKCQKRRVLEIGMVEIDIFHLYKRINSPSVELSVELISLTYHVQCAENHPQGPGDTYTGRRLLEEPRLLDLRQPQAPFQG